MVRDLALKQNARRVELLNQAERGRTVFIIGSGPQLNSLTPFQISKLAQQPTIGVNRTQYQIRLRYFLSAYPAEVLLASRVSASTTVIHMRPEMHPPLIRSTVAVRRVDHRLGDPLPRSLDPYAPEIHTLRNVVLGATHLALIMGAGRVVYVGVEQNSALHFYDERPEIRASIIEDLRSLRSVDLFDIDHPYATVDALVEKLKLPPADLATQAFYKRSHAQSFRSYFGNLLGDGVAVFATTPDSVIAAAGAEVVTVEEALRW